MSRLAIVILVALGCGEKMPSVRADQPASETTAPSNVVGASDAAPRRPSPSASIDPKQPSTVAPRIIQHSLLHTWNLKGWVRDAEFSPNGRWVIAAADVHDRGMVKVLDVKSHALKHRWKLTGTPEDVAVSANGTFVAVASKHYGMEAPSWKLWSLVVYDLETGKRVMRWHGEELMNLAFSPDSKFLIAGHGHSASVFSLESKSLVRTKEFGKTTGNGTPHGVVFDENGLAYVRTAHGIHILDVHDEAKDRDIPINGGNFALGAHSKSISVGGATIATVAFRASALVTPSGEQKATTQSLGDDLTGVHLSPDSTRVLTTARNGRLVLSNASTGKEVRSWAQNEESIIWDARFFGDGNHLVTGAIDGKVVFYDVDSDVEAGHWQADKEDGIFSVALSLDNAMVLLGSQDGKLHLLSLSAAP